MLSKLKAGLAIVAAALLAQPSAAQARLPEPLAAYVEQAMREAQMPGIAIAVVRGDDPPIAQGFGIRRLGRPERVDADTIFNIASLTKSFTAAGAAVLVDEHRLDWNDPASRWLPQLGFSDPWLTAHVTLADLLSHRTGLQAANTAWYLSGADRAEVLRRVRYLEPFRPFRTEQVYNNALYTVAGEVSAAAAGQSWEALIRSRLIQPLGMAATRVGEAPASRGNVASPHALLDGRQQPIPPADYRATAPAGGMESTARDMIRWLRFQLGDGSFEGRRILSAATLQAMHEPWVMIPTTPAMRANRQVQFFAGYGLGWNVMDYRGRKLLWHSGNADGMPSYMALLPEERIGVVVMMNSWVAPYLHGDLVSRMLDHYLGLPTRDYAAETLARMRAQPAPAPPPPAIAMPAADLAAYPGDYVSDLYGALLVRSAGAGLTLQVGEGETADLAPIGPDRFAVRWRNRAIGADADTRLVFGRDADGAVERMAVKVRRDQIEARRQ